MPGECTFSIDRRLIPGETRESAVAEIVATLDDIAREDPAFRYELDVDPRKDHIPANITEESVTPGAGAASQYHDGDGTANPSISSPGPAPRTDASTARRESTPSAMAPAARTLTAPMRRS